MIGAIFVKFSQLILMKIIKIVATRSQILRLKCTKFNFGWSSAPDPAGGAYSTPLAGLKAPTSKGRGGERWKWRERKGPLYFLCGSMPMINYNQCRCRTLFFYTYSVNDATADPFGTGMFTFLM